ncbi:hypothetical protein AB205_0087420 [Aquarana catesbeiana]|uniref:Uncharacterized protein n=1 Tax=Aquarana catesbeiana TaxID=8400 RepID=A0A2G9RCF4_AQUCT|nr:hypothetical protein AB205_0087420 [Aquarana catesbeiana]
MRLIVQKIFSEYFFSPPQMRLKWSPPSMALSPSGARFPLYMG